MAVSVAVEHDTDGPLPVPARPPRLLVVALDGLGEGLVDHEPHVGLVDPHPEGDGGADHLHLVLDPRLLGRRPLLRGEAGVVRLHRQVPHDVRQLVRRVVSLLLGQAIDDPRLKLAGLVVTEIGLYQAGNVFDGSFFPLLWPHFIFQIGSVET